MLLSHTETVINKITRVFQTLKTGQWVGSSLKGREETQPLQILGFSCLSGGSWGQDGERAEMSDGGFFSVLKSPCPRAHRKQRKNFQNLIFQNRKKLKQTNKQIYLPVSSLHTPPPKSKTRSKGHKLVDCRLYGACWCVLFCPHSIFFLKLEPTMGDFK